MIAYHLNNEIDDRPLFGVSTRRERLWNLIAGVLTTIAVAFTYKRILLSTCILSLEYLFAFCIAFICVSLIILIHWYRQGDVDPKFRKMIYYNSFTIVLLCVCANLYIHNIKLPHFSGHNTTAT